MFYGNLLLRRRIDHKVDSIMISIFRLGCILLAIGICSCGGAPEFSNDWDEDFYTFSEELKSNHKNPFTLISEQEFDLRIQEMRVNASNFSDEENMIELMKLISDIGDSHTLLNLNNRTDFFPIQLGYFSDGISTIGLPGDLSEYNGRILSEIGGVDINLVIDDFRALIPYENESKFEYEVVRYLPGEVFLDHFNLLDEERVLSITFKDGTEISLPKSGDITPLTIESIPLDDPPTYGLM